MTTTTPDTAVADLADELNAFAYRFASLGRDYDLVEGAQYRVLADELRRAAKQLQHVVADLHSGTVSDEHGGDWAAAAVTYDSRIHGVIDWLAERRNSPGMTTIGMVQDRLRSIPLEVLAASA